MTKEKHEKKKDRGSGSRNNKIPRQENPFRVLGIAMIVDQRGIGARMMCRYPTKPTALDLIDQNERDRIDALESSSSDDYHRHHPHSDEYSNDDLFFTLTARQMAKLFRTKKSLCGQPMTLTVNGTVLCCRAVLMDIEEEETTTETTKNELLQFSVIVALSSPVSHTSVPFSWIDGATEDQLDLQRYLKEATAMAASESNGSRSNKKSSSSSGSVSSAFLSIRRVHISLARYCRVLEREEKRCQYITEQANHFFKLRNERQKKWEQQKVVASSIPAQTGTTNTASSSASVLSSSAATNVGGVNRHVRQQSLSTMDDYFSLGTVQSSSKITTSVEEEQEKEQDILELMLSAFQQNDSSTSNRLLGNLARELVQVFHSLSRNDYDFPPTPTALLCERDGVVYCNNHIAIPIDAASLKPSQVSIDGPLVRPYYTLLFPHASPSELLEAFQASGSAAPQRLQQLLLTVNPQMPLSEIAVDANLPLYTLLQIASYLVTHGATVTSPVVSRNSRLSCLHIEKIPQLALEFSQMFANVNFFRLVGFLTSSKTLGEAMSILTNVDNDEGLWLRECLAPSVVVSSSKSKKKVLFFPEDQSSKGALSQNQQPGDQPRRRWVEELEEMLYAMSIWLLSHRVLTQTQDYLVVTDLLIQQSSSTATKTTTAVPPAPPTSVFHSRATMDADENLFRELLDSEFLNGNVSIMALSWRLGLSQQKVRSWGLRHPRIRVVSRIPAPGDDWEFEPS
jgi:hypothetical protein